MSDAYYYFAGDDKIKISKCRELDVVAVLAQLRRKDCREFDFNERYK